MALALRRYRKALYASRLIEPAELDAFERALPRDSRPATPTALAEALVAAGKLTRFQAAEIAAGRTTGLVLGNYVLLDRIGAGGMGQVFKAWHRHMQRTVALKTLPDQAAAGEDSIARFRREILSAAQLSHPNIVAAYDADVSSGVHYLVMEYIDGVNLATLVRERGPLPPVQAVKYVLDAARGLAYAHARGIVHRDVKPSNLIVDRADIVKVLDLGLARPAALPREAELTLPGDVLGTLEYMAPEQAIGRNDLAVDGRADIYGLGCTLYRLVTGELPYHGGSPRELIAAHRDQRIPSLRALREEVPRPLDDIFKRMVAKQASDRFPHMDDVMDALERVRLPGREKSARRSRTASRSAVAEEPSSGDDIELAPTAGAPPPESDRKTSGQPAGLPASGTVEPPVVRPAVSPAVALLVLIAALAGLTSLSWFDSRSDVNVVEAVPPGQNATAYSAAGDRQRAWSQALGVPIALTNSLSMQLVLVPPDGLPDDSSPATLVAPFYYGANEITLADYRQFLAAGGSPAKLSSPASGAAGSSQRQGDRHPVIGLTAAEAEAFCSWLSEREGASYRLPTEAEFAHACRAGAAGPFWFDPKVTTLGRYAWCDGRTHLVGLLEPSPLGLHDLLGNASEWCLLADQSDSGRAGGRHGLCGESSLPTDRELTAEARRVDPSATGGLRLVLDLPLEARWPR
ncbi:MAG TPA: bifunctional serine/threonine-protein kinase/formylglycine-generating enzyme family protein [Pirellulales bacterium]|nr:bifunctional serine/threonine-protein kinase/formylglycine-generating enzyme family protein [Pirellulales bacterium]